MVEFTVTLSQESVQEVTVQFATSSGTAIEGRDYTASNGTLTVNAGDTTKTIEVSTRDNASFDGDRMFEMILSGVMNADLQGGGAQLAAQGTILENDPEPIPASWPLVPPNVAPGDSFRLLFTSSTKTHASSSDLTVYDAVVQRDAASGHQGIRDYSSNFKALASTATVNARYHTDSAYSNADPGVPIYWLNGAKVAADYRDFYDGNWDSNSPRHASGSSAEAGDEILTGSKSNGTKHGDGVPGPCQRPGANRQAGKSRAARSTAALVRCARLTSRKSFNW